MSIVEDPGPPDLPPIPLSELRSQRWLEIWEELDRRYPDMAREQQAQTLSEALANFRHDSANSGVPVEYLNALRTGIPDARYKITIDGVDVRFAVVEPGSPPYDPSREQQSWQEFRDAVTNISNTGGSGIHETLPTELALAVWNVDGRRIYARRPRTPARNRSRPRHLSWGMLSPLPITTALAQKVGAALTGVGETAAAGTAVAGLLMAPVLPAPTWDAAPRPSRPPASRLQPAAPLNIPAEHPGRERPSWTPPASTPTGTAARLPSPKAQPRPRGSAKPGLKPTPRPAPPATATAPTKTPTRTPEPQPATTTRLTPPTSRPLLPPGLLRRVDPPHSRIPNPTRDGTTSRQGSPTNSGVRGAAR